MSTGENASEAPKPPTPAEDVETTRKAYRAALAAASGPTDKDRNTNEATNKFHIMTVLAEQRHEVERAKLAYEEAAQRLQADQALEAQARGEKIQRSLTCATWWMAVFTVVIAATTIWAACHGK